MDKEKQEEAFFVKLKEVCKDTGRTYEFHCPNCGGYAMGFLSPSIGAVVGSCTNCHIVGKRYFSDHAGAEK